MAASSESKSNNGMRPLRSLLFAPGNHARRSEKALTLHADAVILDLEDACPVAEKIATRQLIATAMAKPRSCIGYVRVNPLSTDFGYGDILAVVGPEYRRHRAAEGRKRAGTAYGGLADRAGRTRKRTAERSDRSSADPGNRQGLC